MLVGKHSNMIDGPWLAFCLLSLLFSFTNVFSAKLDAKQLAFKQEIKSHKHHFVYTWQHEDTNYTLEFSLDKQELMDMPRSPVRYNPKLVQDIVYSTVLKEAQRLQSRTVKTSVRKTSDGLNFNVSAGSSQEAQEILDKLSQIHIQAKQDYWDIHYFVQAKSPWLGTNLRHDHSKYTQQSKDALKPIVEAIKNMQQNPRDPREFISILSHWIQTIPYNELQNRVNSNGAGFVSPKDLLIYNQGDCDSKSTLMASILKAYSNNIDVRMVYLPQHALLAIAMQGRKNEHTLTFNKRQYVLVEPTGPAQYKLGEIDQNSALALRNKQFDTISL